MSVQIINQEETKNDWVFLVDVDGQKHKVTVEKQYWQKLTDGEEEPEGLVRRSFDFLLRREPKEQILKEFNLKLIQDYFPEYESEI